MRRSGDGRLNRDQLLSSYDETARMVDEQIAKFRMRQQTQDLQHHRDLIGKPATELNSDLDSVAGDEAKTPADQRSSAIGDFDTERESVLLNNSTPTGKPGPPAYSLQPSDLFIQIHKYVSPAASQAKQRRNVFYSPKRQAAAGNPARTKQSAFVRVH